MGYVTRDAQTGYGEVLRKGDEGVDRGREVAGTGSPDPVPA